MGIKGIIFMMVALIGFLINFFAKPVAEKCFHREIRDDEILKIKLPGLIIVVIGVSLLMIFGK